MPAVAAVSWNQPIARSPASWMWSSLVEWLRRASTNSSLLSSLLLGGRAAVAYDVSVFSLLRSRLIHCWRGLRQRVQCRRVALAVVGPSAEADGAGGRGAWRGRCFKDEG